MPDDRNGYDGPRRRDHDDRLDDIYKQGIEAATKLEGIEEDVKEIRTTVSGKGGHGERITAVETKVVGLQKEARKAGAVTGFAASIPAMLVALKAWWNSG